MLKRLGDMSELSAEVSAEICIVGAGPAGLAAAAGLAKRGKSVVLLESGPVDAAESLAELNEVETSNPHYLGPKIGRARTTGGTSSLWGGRLIPLTAEDMGARSALDIPAWPISHEELYAYAPEAEALFGVARTGGYEDVPPTGKQKIVGSDEHIRCRAPKIVPISRRNVYWTLGKEVEASPNLTLYAGATVTSIEFDPELGRAIAATATGIHGRTLKVRFDTLVLAAGTLETTRLLLLVDRESGERAFADNQALGRYFTDHIALDVGSIGHYSGEAVALMVGHARHGGVRRALHFELAPQVQSHDEIASAYLCLRLDIGEGPVTRLRSAIKQRQSLGISHLKDLAASPAAIYRAALWRMLHRQADLPDFIEIAAEIRIEQAPSSQNKLRLSDRRDPFGVPLLGIDWDLRETDRKTFSRSLDYYRRYWSRHDISRHCSIHWRDYPSLPTSLPAGSARDVFHPSGSTRMGTDRRQSVVGPDLSCHAVPNVSILSPSVFPSAGSVNPMLTLVSLATRLAHHLS